MKQYAHKRLAELEQIANTKVQQAEKQAQQQVEAEKGIAEQRFH